MSEAQRKVEEVADLLHSAAIHVLRRAREEDHALGVSPARLSALYDKTCSACGSSLEPADEPIARPALDDRLGHLIARREVARAQARVDSERWPVKQNARRNRANAAGKQATP